MHRTSLKFSLAVAVTAVAISASLSSAEKAPTASGQAKRFVGSAVLAEGPVKGIVAVVQRGKREKVRTSVSLHGLTPDFAYRVVGGTRGCSSSRVGTSVFEIPIEPRAAQDVFVTELVRRTGPVAGVNCVRIYKEQSDSDIASQVSVGGFGGGVDD